jgi:hypothetical protein
LAKKKYWKQDCTVWIVHVHAEDRKDFGGSRGVSSLCRNKWGNWWDYWFYVSGSKVEDLPRLPAAVMCSHCYVAFPQFEVAEDDEDEGALRCDARMSSGRDLVEEFIGYGVWPLAHGWVLGEVCPRQMPTLGQQLV